MKSIAAAVSALVVTGGALSVAMRPAGHGWSDAHKERMRGTDAYYEVSETQGRVQPLSIRLNGTPEIFLQLGFVFTFRKGRELEVAIPLLEARMPYLVDALLMVLPERDPAELRTGNGKLALKRWLLETTQRRLFPDGEARVERVFLDPLFLQATGAK
jgi:flagellar basal body-associated protein FliL